MKKKKKKSFSKKLNRVVNVVQLAVTVIVAAATVYSLIPKNEKIKAVDTEALIAANLPKDESSEEATPAL